MIFSSLSIWIRKIDKLFVVAVALPVATAFLYFGVFASDVYVSEAKFVVKSPERPNSAGFGALLERAGFSNASEEIYETNAFILSRDALQQLNKDGLILKAYANGNVSIFDRYNPLGSNSSFEGLYKYYRKKVNIDIETSSSITTLTVRAYTPEDAHEINKRLLGLSEGLVNRLNKRGRSDLIVYAEREVAEAQASSQKAAATLAAYRNLNGVIDPEKEAVVNLQMISKLQDDLISTKVQLLQLRRLAANNPQIPLLEARRQGLKGEIAEQIAGIAGGSRSLAAAAVKYKQLELETEFASKRLAVAMSSLEEAKNDARRKQAYVERIAEPSRPDYPLEPRRIRAVLAIILLSLIGWGIIRMLLVSVKEHAD